MNKESVPKTPGTDWTLNEVSINRGTTLTAVEVCLLFNGDLASAQELFYCKLETMNVMAPHKILKYQLLLLEQAHVSSCDNAMKARIV